jgi:uncharacterized membrane protein
MDISFIPTVSAASSVLDSNAAYTASDIIRVAISLIVLVGWLCAIIFIIWWGLMLILSGGKDEKVKPAINSIRYAVIGIIVIVVAIFVAPKVSEMLGLGQHDYLSPKSVFTTIQMLMSRIFGTSSGSNYDSTTSDLTDFADF